jgi:maltose alpha-D-glucosyltransferase / alpha-amylase
MGINFRKGELMIINNLGDDGLWYKDGVIYQVHIKAYRDSNNDGVGDIPGLIEKLDYIKSLGVDIIWMLPFYPSPLKDDGYDIADYLNINPDYGTIEDFKRFLREAHKRKIKVITELVLNHTSDQHQWFQRARKSPKGSPERDYYVWSDTQDKYKEARIIFSDFEASNWSWDSKAKAYYWHRFYSHQPDLNFDNPRVHKSLLKVVDFWFELGVDGLRLDAVPYLYEREGTNCENLPETHQFLKKINVHVQSKYKNKMLLAEANQWPEDAVEYFGNGDECQMAFHFPLMPRIYMATQMENRFPIIDILEQTPPIPDNCQWAMFLRNHDELTLEMVTDEERDYMYRYFARDTKAKINLGIRRRLAPLMENSRRKIELMNILLFSFPGTPIIYYGDEIGMGDNYYLGDRNGVRTPMQWSPDRNAGFSDTNPQKLFLPVIIDPEYNYETVNVEVQERTTTSLLWWMKRAIAIRKKYKAFGRGTLEFLSPSNAKVLSFLRKHEEEVMLVVVNLSRYSQAVELDLRDYSGYTPVEVFSRNKFPLIQSTWYMLTLNPHDYYWFALEKQKDHTHQEVKDIPELITKKSWRKFLQEDIDFLIEEGIIYDFFSYHQKGDLQSSGFQNIELIDHIFLSDDYMNSVMFFRINYLDKAADILLLPMKAASGKDAEFILNSRTSEVIVKLRSEKEDFILYDGIYDEEFRKIMFESFFLKKSLKGRRGEITVSLKKRTRKIISRIEEPESNILKVLPTSYNLQYTDKMFLKIYSRPEEGTQPGEELLNFFETSSTYKNVPSLDGAIYYVPNGKRPLTIGILNEYVAHQGTAWKYFSDALGRYFDNVISKDPEQLKKTFVLNNFFSETTLEDNALLCEAADIINLNNAALLGIRTGEMHKALTSDSERKDFAPEQFSTLYQRSVYQSIRSSIRNTFRSLRSNETYNDLMSDMADKEDKLLKFSGIMVDKKITADKLRIHGDYHLGQILFTGKDFIITNFEGIYSAALSERRLKRSPLRDIASLLWSFHYAAFQGLEKYRSQGVGADLDLEYFARQWWFCMSSSFLKGYFNTISGASFVPDSRETIHYMINFYLLDKTFMEMNNLLSKSPELLHIPVDLINYILNDMESIKN